MRIDHRRLVATILACSVCTIVQAEGFYLGLGVGGGDADFDDPVFSSGDPFSFDGESDVVVGEFMLGYEFPSDVFVEFGLQGYDTFEVPFLGDVLDLDSIRLGVGYLFPSESNFRFIGKAGFSFWDLKARESILFNPGPEEVSSLDGTDFFIEGGVEYSFNDTFRAGLALSYADLDFGSTTAVKLTFKILP